MTQRSLAVMVHPTHPDAPVMAAAFIEAVQAHGIVVGVPADHLPTLLSLVPDSARSRLVDQSQLTDAEVVVVFGGDGTILRAGEWALPRHVPLLGINLGHVGFLAELEPSGVPLLVRLVVERHYEVEERLTLQVTVHDADDRALWRSFAVNEVSLEKAARERMVEVLATIDGRRLSQWGCDGVLVSTPTGSTAYAFSAGGPVMWPDVEALIVVPLSAHALFARALVISPRAHVDLTVMPQLNSSAVVWCDGRRSFDVAPGQRVEVVRGPDDLLIARLSEQPFADRLVRKFGLRVEGWRNMREAPTDGVGELSAGHH
ncbi:NAD kinase [Aestuariimicrobium sp. T2.26MG-19.2B]|uniref:NAD kinase n=1 Tax=Aestuariimicrobium sp. T2.26MG-19.2B TaxID=3040679 RepID=UPI002477B262|nr:NAD kinase [Aestuariimicrobium sp. T2.26MG-19.2B]CAI9408116.1 NAD kinase [Aestuariimicrobium sp. T2.26MG-19.2B]